MHVGHVISVCVTRSSAAAAKPDDDDDYQHDLTCVSSYIQTIDARANCVSRFDEEIAQTPRWYNFCSKEYSDELLKLRVHETTPFPTAS